METHTLLHSTYIDIFIVSAIIISLINPRLVSIFRELISNLEQTGVQGRSRLKVGTSDHGDIHNIFPSGAAPELRPGVELFVGTSTTQGSHKVESRASQDGGKIAEKANANGNSLDIGGHPYSRG